MDRCPMTNGVCTPHEFRPCHCFPNRPTEPATSAAALVTLVPQRRNRLRQFAFAVWKAAKLRMARITAWWHASSSGDSFDFMLEKYDKADERLLNLYRDFNRLQAKSAVLDADMQRIQVQAECIRSGHPRVSRDSDRCLCGNSMVLMG